MQIELIKPYEKNAKEHNPKQIKLISESIKRFGFASPIVIDKNNEIIAGHGRLEGAKLAGIKDVPVVVMDKLTDKEVKALRLADNQINAMTGNDMSLVIEELKGLPDDLIDLTGFDKDLLIEPDEADDIIPENVPSRSKLGDLYELGQHRVLCGDSTQQEAVLRLMDGKKADMVFTDPPYGVDYSNAERPNPSKSDLGKIKNDNIDLSDFLPKVYVNLDIFSQSNCSFYIWYADKTTVPFYSSLEKTAIKFCQMLIWKKPMLLGRGRYQYAHEPCIFAVKGTPYQIKDRKKTTVWDFGGYDKSKNKHPTQKPVFLAEEAIINSSNGSNNIVLDLFLGSGSTLIASEKTGRICYGMELDPKYIDVIVQRYVDYTGQTELVKNGKIEKWTLSPKKAPTKD